MFNKTNVNQEDKAQALAQLLIFRPGEWYTFKSDFGRSHTIHTAQISVVSDTRLELHFCDTYYSIDKKIHEELQAILKKHSSSVKPTTPPQTSQLQPDGELNTQSVRDGVSLGRVE